MPGGTLEEAVKVVVRIRPETLNNPCLTISNEQTVSLIPPKADESHNKHLHKENKTSRQYKYKVDKIFPPEASQQDLYNMVKPLVESVVQGYNTTVFAYGQTGSGKTHSIIGQVQEDNGGAIALNGILPRTVRDIFAHVEKACKENPDDIFLIQLSVVELYKNEFHDLLGGSEYKIEIREHPRHGVYLEGSSTLRVPMRSSSETMQKIIQGLQNRSIAATSLNSHSSRSHTIVEIIVEQQSLKKKIVKKGKLHLVDLAGSERLSQSHAEGSTLQETRKINLSLACLGNVLSALANKSDSGQRNKKNVVVPYRNSKLTYFLRDSLGGNARTLMIATIRGHYRFYHQTRNTLDYAVRAKRVKNRTVINVDSHQANNNPNGRLKEVTLELVSLRERLKQRTEEFANLQQQQCSGKEENEKLRRRIAELSALNERDRRKHDRLGETIIGGGAQAEMAGKEFSALQESVNSYQEQCRQQKKEIHQLRKSIEFEQHDAKKARMQQEHAEKRLAVTSQKLHALSSSWEGEKLKNAIEINRLKGEAKELETAKAKLLKENQMLTSGLANANHQLLRENKHTAQIKELKEKLARKAVNDGKQQLEMIDLKENYQKLRKEHEDIVKRFMLARSSLEEKEQMIEQTSKTIHDQRASFTVYRKRLQRATKQRDDAVKELDKLQKEHKKFLEKSTGSMAVQTDIPVVTLFAKENEIETIKRSHYIELEKKEEEMRNKQQSHLAIMDQKDNMLKEWKERVAQLSTQLTELTATTKKALLDAECRKTEVEQKGLEVQKSMLTKITKMKATQEQERTNSQKTIDDLEAVKRRLESDCDEMKDRLAKKDEKQKNLEKALETLQQEISKTNHAAESQLAEFKKLKLDQTTKINDLSTALAEKEAACAKQKLEYTTLTKEFTTIKNAWQAKFEKISKEDKQKLEKCQRLESTVQELESKVDQLESKAGLLQEKLDITTNELTESKTDMRHLQNQAKDLRIVNEDLVGKVKLLKQVEADFQKIVQEKDRSILTLQKQLLKADQSASIDKEKLGTVNKQLQQELQSASELHQAFKWRILETKALGKEKDAVIASLKKNINELKLLLSAKENTLKENILQVNILNTELRKTNSELLKIRGKDDIITTQKNNISEIQSMLRSKENDLRQKELQIDILNAELRKKDNELTTLATKAESQHMNVEIQKKKFLDECEMQMKRIKALEEALQKAMKEKDDHFRESQSKLTIVNDLRSTEIRNTKHIQNLTITLEKKETTILELKETFSTRLKKAKEEAKNIIQNVQVKCTDLMQQYKQLETENGELRKELQTKETKISQMQVDIRERLSSIEKSAMSNDEKRAEKINALRDNLTRSEMICEKRGLQISTLEDKVKQKHAIIEKLCKAHHLSCDRSGMLQNDFEMQNYYLKERVCKQKAQLRKLVGSMEVMHTDLLAKNKNIQALKETINNLEGNFITRGNEFEQESIGKDSRIEVLEKELKDLQAQRETEEKENIAKIDRIQGMITQMNDEEMRRRGECGVQILKLKSELHKQKQLAKKCTEKLTIARNRFQKELDQLHEVVENEKCIRAKQDVAQKLAEKTIHDLNQELEKLKENEHLILHSESNLRNEIQSMAIANVNQAEADKEKIAGLVASIESFKEQLHSCKTEIANAQIEKASLVDSHQRHLKQVKGQFEALIEEFEQKFTQQYRFLRQMVFSALEKMCFRIQALRERANSLRHSGNIQNERAKSLEEILKNVKSTHEATMKAVVEKHEAQINQHRDAWHTERTSLESDLNRHKDALERHQEKNGAELEDLTLQSYEKDLQLQRLTMANEELIEEKDYRGRQITQLCNQIDRLEHDLEIASNLVDFGVSNVNGALLGTMDKSDQPVIVSPFIDQGDQPSHIRFNEINHKREALLKHHINLLKHKSKINELTIGVFKNMTSSEEEEEEDEKKNSDNDEVISTLQEKLRVSIKETHELKIMVKLLQVERTALLKPTTSTPKSAIQKRGTQFSKDDDDNEGEVVSSEDQPLLGESTALTPPTPYVQKGDHLDTNNDDGQKESHNDQENGGALDNVGLKSGDLSSGGQKLEKDKPFVVFDESKVDSTTKSQKK
eukprot:g3411.t1